MPAGRPPKISNLFKTPVINSQNTTGAAGYDNPRENIDPHIRTNAVSLREIDGSPIIFRESGSETARFTGGKLGIGTSTPSLTLNVQHVDGNYAMGVTRSPSAGTTGIAFYNGGGFIGALQANSNGVYFSDTNVGIGTSSPGTNLHIVGSTDAIIRATSADGSAALLDLGDASDPDGGRIVYDTASNLSFYTSSTERLRIDSAGKIGIGTVTPAASAKLDITSTTGALLVPRMTTAQVTALTAVNGMIVYDTTLNQFKFYENGAWVTGSGLA